MLDLLFVVVMLGLFGLTALFVEVCDRLIGPDDAALDAESAPAAPAPERRAA